MFWELKPEGSLPDVSDLGEPRGSQLHGPSGIFQLSQETVASLCLPGIETPCQTEHSGPRAVTLSSHVLVPAGVLWLGLKGVPCLSPAMWQN